MNNSSYIKNIVSIQNLLISNKKNEFDSLNNKIIEEISVTEEVFNKVIRHFPNNNEFDLIKVKNNIITNYEFMNTIQNQLFSFIQEIQKLVISLIQHFNSSLGNEEFYNNFLNKNISTILHLNLIDVLNKNLKSFIYDMENNKLTNSIVVTHLNNRSKLLCNQKIKSNLNEMNINSNKTNDDNSLFSNILNDTCYSNLTSLSLTRLSNFKFSSFNIFQNLTTLKFYDCEFFSNNLCLFICPSSLKILQISNCKINNLSAKIFLTKINESNIETLSLSHNYISSIVCDNLCLNSLSQLDLSHNKLMSIENQFLFQLPKLSFLLLNNNYLQMLPDQISNKDRNILMIISNNPCISQSIHMRNEYFLYLQDIILNKTISNTYPDEICLSNISTSSDKLYKEVFNMNYLQLKFLYKGLLNKNETEPYSILILPDDCKLVDCELKNIDIYNNQIEIKIISETNQESLFKYNISILNQLLEETSFKRMNLSLINKLIFRGNIISSLLTNNNENLLKINRKFIVIQYPILNIFTIKINPYLLSNIKYLNLSNNFLRTKDIDIFYKRNMTLVNLESINLSNNLLDESIFIDIILFKECLFLKNVNLEYNKIKNISNLLVFIKYFEEKTYLDNIYVSLKNNPFEIEIEKLFENSNFDTSEIIYILCELNSSRVKVNFKKLFEI